LVPKDRSNDEYAAANNKHGPGKNKYELHRSHGERLPYTNTTVGGFFPRYGELGAGIGD
jgi:hypothetical protein|tara:strand:- start:167 stop:343 length:177 start_codon:yes stop_codon:yes gene_type:complete